MTQNESGQWAESSVVSQNIQTTQPCQAMSTLPTDFASQTQAGGGTANYSPSSQPLTAAHAIQGVTSKTFFGFAFSAMDSSEADFYGLLPANLQNAAGNFVAPSTTAITAALNDGDVQPQRHAESQLHQHVGCGRVSHAHGHLRADLDESRRPSTTQADQLTELLTNLVNYSGSAGAGTSNPLPPGYVALPSNLQKQALAAIASDVIAPNGQPVGGEAAAAASLASNSGASSANVVLNLSRTPVRSPIRTPWGLRSGSAASPRPRGPAPRKPARTRLGVAAAV